MKRNRKKEGSRRWQSEAEKNRIKRGDGGRFRDEMEGRDEGHENSRRDQGNGQTLFHLISERSWKMVQAAARLLSMFIYFILFISLELHCIFPIDLGIYQSGHKRLNKR